MTTRYLRVVRVQVLVDIEDQVGGGTIGVGDLHESRARTVGNEGLCRGVVVSGQQNELRCCATVILAESETKQAVPRTQRCGWR